MKEYRESCDDCEDHPYLDLVCSMVSGTGWTAIACKKLFRNFWGCDINPKYVEQAKERVKQVLQNIDLFARNKE